MAEVDFGNERIDIGIRGISFIGPEGAGKSEIAKPLSVATGKPYFTTGDAIRDIAATDHGPLGDKCREIIKNADYLPGTTLLKIVLERLSKPDVAQGFIMDGGLRTLTEARGFPETLSEAGITYPLDVIYMDIPEEMSYERLIFGENARKREDDTVEKLASRLQKFKYQLAERVEEINKQPNWRFFIIDATKSKKEVYDSVVQSILS